MAKRDDAAAVAEDTLPRWRIETRGGKFRSELDAETLEDAIRTFNAECAGDYSRQQLKIEPLNDEAAAILLRIEDDRRRARDEQKTAGYRAK